MKNKVLPDIKNAEANYEELKNKRKVHIISNYSEIFRNDICNFFPFYTTHTHTIYIYIYI